MKRAGFIIFSLVAYPVSWLPFPLLYLISDAMYIILFFIIRYRRTVVQANLKNSFPEKNKKEIAVIEKKFYRNLCDITLESLKMISISRGELLRRNSFDDLSFLEQYKAKHKSVIAVLGHFANWEWCGFSLSAIHPIKVVTIYKPLSNQYFDRFLFRIRSRFGIILVKMEEVYRVLVRLDEPIISLFIADQTPPNTRGTYWTRFLSQDTPVFLGIEKVAIKLNSPIVIFYPLRVKRGYYKIYHQVLLENPEEHSQNNEITELHVKFLEGLIKQYPELWLWSHRRWKHKRILNEETISKND